MLVVFYGFMPLVTTNTLQRRYDAIVVGSGAGGGMAAYILATSGLRVLMLEAGRNYDPVRETRMWNTPEQAPLRAAATPEHPLGYYNATIGGGWQVPDEPYLQAEGANFQWWRPRMLGGRTNHWGRLALRMGPYDFKPRSRDGLGVDWPLEYQDLAPYYDKVEMLIGVTGSNEGLNALQNTPPSPEGILLPAPSPRAYEILTQRASRRLGIPCIPAHLAILSRKQDGKNLSEKIHPNNAWARDALRKSMDSRSVCAWATPCSRGCKIKANFQSPTVLIPPALETGNLDILTNAMVREVTLDGSGRANGVHYIDKRTRKDRHIRGRLVVLAAGTCESSRLLLNSRSPSFPNGLANGSGQVGRNLMDSVGGQLLGQIPALENLPAHNEDGASAMHVYMPWWKYQEQLDGKLDFARGYHMEFTGGRRLPEVGTFDRLTELKTSGYGRAFKEDCRRFYGSFLKFTGRGEMIPNEHCFCEIDSKQVDTWGIPVLRFHWQWSEHETRQAAHMRQTFSAIIETLGGRVIDPAESDGRSAIDAPGSSIHEVGTVCMGADRKTSVLNSYGQAWDVNNLFVADGSCFVSSTDKAPTLTILALAWRTGDYIVDLVKKGEI